LWLRPYPRSRHCSAFGYELVDELGRAIRGGKESGIGDGESCPISSPARLFRYRRLFHPCRGAKAKGFATGDLEHGRSVYQSPRRLAPGCRDVGATAESQSTDDRYNGRTTHRLLPARAALL